MSEEGRKCGGDCFRYNRKRQAGGEALKGIIFPERRLTIHVIATYNKPWQNPV
jgi:hypothetical protein